MSLTINQFCKGFEAGADRIRQISKQFCLPLGITTFAYVRVYKKGYASWLTSNPDQDRFLLESGALNDDPLLDTPEALKEGHYLWFNDREFPGCETFYKDRTRLFQMDHGLVVVKHNNDYLETCCFSGLLSKKPLYNLFMNERGLFSTFMEHLPSLLDRSLLKHLEQGITLSEIKSAFGKSSAKLDRSEIVKACGRKELLKLSKREKECLLLLKEGNTFESTGEHLEISSRTVEQYINSVKNKLGVQARTELFHIADKLVHLGLSNPLND